MLQTQQPAVKSQAAVVRSVDLNAKISLLEENVESLLNQDRNITEEVREATLKFESVTNELVNQVKQINVSVKYSAAVM